MSVSKFMAVVFGGIVALIAAGMIIGGGALLWAQTTQTDDDGFLTSPAYEMETTSYAVVSPEVDIATRPGEWFPADLAEVKFTVDSATPVFVGIGDAAAVDGFLGDVNRAEIDIVGADADDVEYTNLPGGSPVTGPAGQDFWVASAAGVGTQTLSWEVTQGEWAMVVMNVDGSAGITTEFSAGVTISILMAITIALLVVGFLFAGLAAALLVWAIARPGEPDVTAFPAGATQTRYPVLVEGHLDPQLTRWQWLVKWFLAIPHVIVLAFLWFAFFVLTVVAFFAILFTGRYPHSIFEFNVGVMRWSWRVEFYAFGPIGTDQYPPFTLAPTNYPARFDVAYPESLSRGLVLVKWWLLAIPHYLIVGLLTSGLVWWTVDLDGDAVLRTGGGLLAIFTMIAGIALLFTGRYPQGLFDLVMGFNRWVYRVAAYATLMRDEYPPFRLDLGGSEPPPERPMPPETGPSGTDAREPTLTGA